MTLDDVRRAVDTERHALRSRGVRGLYVFGSVARGEASPGSDVDMLIEVEDGTPFSILDLVGIKNRLSGALGRDADVHLKDGLHWRIRDDVLREAVRVL
jgi:predicted nucleotidyltransferase